MTKDVRVVQDAKTQSCMIGIARHAAHGPALKKLSPCIAAIMFVFKPSKSAVLLPAPQNWLETKVLLK
jgi:hypothetical protein